MKLKKLALTSIASILSFILCQCGDDNYIVYSDDNFCIVNPLEKGNKYKTEDFSKKYVERLRDIYGDNLSSIDIDERYTYLNFMPNSIFDKYHIGAFSVSYKDQLEDVFYHDYYLFFDDELIGLDSWGRSDCECGFVQFLFSDYNHDGFFEITVSSYFISSFHIGTAISFLGTFDSKSKSYAHSDTIYNKYLTFKCNKAGAEIRQRNIDENGVISAEDELYSSIRPYNRIFKFNAEEYVLRSENYKVVVTFESGTVSIPLIYEALTLDFYVSTEMTWLGESFSYTSGTNYLEGAVAKFKYGDHVFAMAEYDIGGFVVTNFTINKGRIIRKIYRYLDSLSLNNPLGDYDMIISYRGESVTQEKALSVID